MSNLHIKNMHLHYYSHKFYHFFLSPCLFLLLIYYILHMHSSAIEKYFPMHTVNSPALPNQLGTPPQSCWVQSFYGPGHQES